MAAIPSVDREPVRRPPDSDQKVTLPWWLRAAAAWSGRLLIIAAAVYVAVLVLGRLRLLTLAVVAALLLAALLQPVHLLLRRLRLPPALAALATILVLLAVLALAVGFIWNRAAAQLDSLRANVTAGVDQIRDWLVTGPLSLSPDQIDQIRGELVGLIGGGPSGPADGLVGGARMAIEAAAGIVLTLFVLFFLLKDGDRMWAWLVRLCGDRSRGTADKAGRRAWETLTHYVRGILLVALVDAVFVGLALLLIGVPLVLPLALLTFLGAFVPLIGATVAGAAAVLVALVTENVFSALLVLGAVIAVQQLEGNVLQPLIMNKALRIHPLPLAGAVTAGTLFAGIAGAVVAVPILAVCYHVGTYLFGRADGNGETAEGGPADRDQAAAAGGT